MGSRKRTDIEIKACKSPSVQKCLHCTKPDCNVAIGIPYDDSEKQALIVARMVGRKASPRMESDKIEELGKRFRGKAAKA